MRLVACALLLCVGVGAVPAEAKKHRRPARHRVHAPPTPKIRPGLAAPLTATPVVPLTSAPAGDPTAVTPAAAPAAPALPRTLGVSAKEFSFALTRSTVGAGAVTIQLRNAGEDGHDLHIDALDGTPVAAWDELPAESAAVTKTVTLAVGTYRLYCSLPGHAGQGMDTRLTVS